MSIELVDLLQHPAIGHIRERNSQIGVDEIVHQMYYVVMNKENTMNKNLIASFDVDAQKASPRSARMNFRCRVVMKLLRH